MKSGKTSVALLSAHVRRSPNARTTCLCPHSSSWWEVAWNERRIKGMGKEICGNRKTRDFALVDIYLLVDAREGKGAVSCSMNSGAFICLGCLPAWMPLPSLSTVYHESEWTSAEWHRGEYAKQLISVMLVPCSLLGCQFPFWAWRVCKGQVNS